MKTTLQKEENHFNFIRLLAAFLVFYGHSFVLMGKETTTILSHGLGVYVFFIISGYLISVSWDRTPSLKHFLIKRSLRIFPALIAVVLLTVFILGPLITNISIVDYFSHSATYHYLGNIFLHISYSLPGVFTENTYPNAVNGSLWSLPVEFSMYLLIALIGLGTRWKKPIVLVTFLVFAIVNLTWASRTQDVIAFYGIDLKMLFITGVYFFAGSVMYHFNIKRWFSFESFVIALLLLIFSAQWPMINAVLIVILLPILVLSFGLSKSEHLSFFNRADYSYGFYIYAFPVQQTVAHLYPTMGISSYIAITGIITLGFAALSWHLVEKPLLKSPKI